MGKAAWPRHGSARLSHLTQAVPLLDRAFALACAMILAAIATFGLVALTCLLFLFNRGQVFGHDALRAFGQITGRAIRRVADAESAEVRGRRKAHKSRKSVWRWEESRAEAHNNSTVPPVSLWIHFDLPRVRSKHCDFSRSRAMEPWVS